MYFSDCLTILVVEKTATHRLQVFISQWGWQPEDSQAAVKRRDLFNHKNRETTGKMYLIVNINCHDG